jgi:hypothetical protein
MVMVECQRIPGKACMAFSPLSASSRALCKHQHTLHSQTKVTKDTFKHGKITFIPWRLRSCCCTLTHTPLSRLILLQGQDHLLNAVRCDNQHLEAVANLDVTLNCTIERILNQGLDLWSSKGMTLSLLQVVAHAAAGDVLVLEVDLVVEEGHDKTASSTACSALLTLVAADGVVGIHSTLALLIQTTEHCVRVVGEESLSVQNSGQALGAGVDRHGLAMAITVDLADGVEVVAESLTVGGLWGFVEGHLRVESMLSELSIIGLGGIGEGVVGPIH